MSRLSRWLGLLAGRTREGIEVVIYGRSSRHWMRALGPRGPVWTRLPEVASVRLFAPFPSGYRKRLAIPIWESNIDALPSGVWALVPDKPALDVFRDKARFAAYAAEQGLGDFVPRTLDLESNTEFPAVLKCTVLNSGHGVDIVNSREEIATRLAGKPYLGREVVLQSVVEGDIDYVTHLVATHGRILWHCTYAYALATRTTIRRSTKGSVIERCEISVDDIALFERFLGPLDYSGPANIDFKRRSDGSIVIFEVNARFGGSLMRPEFTDDLAAAMAVVVANATLRPAAAQAQ